jgi:hypothetical protein
LGHDGRSFFATVYSRRGFSGVAGINAKSGQMTRIKRFPSRGSYQAGGAFDGRWLVWNQWHGFSSFDDFTTWAWDSRTGRLLRIGSARRGPNGSFWPSPWRSPDVRDRVATWTQGSGPNGLTDVHVYNLKSTHGTVIHTGHSQGAFLLSGRLVAWPESPGPNAYTKMYTASTATGKPVSAPVALRGLAGVSGLATNGDAIAYPDRSFKSLWWSPSLQQPPQEIASASRLHYIDNSVQIGRRYLGFGEQPALFVGDTKMHRYTKIGDHNGWILVDDHTLLVLQPSSMSKSLYARNTIAVIQTNDIPPLPTCS